MTQTIGAKLVAACSQIIPVTLTEEAIDSLPYAVYTLRLSELRTKCGGTVALRGTMEITVYADDYNTAKTKADGIVAAVEGFQDSRYHARLTNTYPTCVNGIWSHYMEYSVAEYAVAASTAPTTAPTELENT